VRDVLSSERRHLGAGATGKSARSCACTTRTTRIALALESLKIFREFEAVVGGRAASSLRVRAAGRSRVPRRAPAQRGPSRRSASDTREVSLDDVRRVLPGVDLAGVGAAAYEPGSGFADPTRPPTRSRRAARPGGATLQTHCEAVRVIVEGGRVAGVETTAGRVATPRS